MASTAVGSDDENEMGDDVAVDYRLLAKLGKKKDKDGQIVIPKRGEKDFEPLERGANVQERALREGREAMFGALEGLRGGNFKTISHAWLQQPLSAATTTTTTTSSLASALPTLLLMRGTHFTTLSHTLRLPQSTASLNGAPPSRPSTVLLPEEALHLLSRGSLVLYASPAPPPTLDLSPQAPTIENQLLAPECAARKMTVQEAAALWAAEVGGGRWEVYVGLKRMGYVVQRAPKFLPKELHPATSDVRAGPSHLPRSSSSWFGAVWGGLRGVLGRLWVTWSGVVSSASRLFRGLLPSLTPSRSLASCALSSSKAEDKEWSTLLSQRSVLPDKKWSYTRIFSRLRIIPNSASPPIISPIVASPSGETPADPLPVEIYFHVWKPASNYKKSNPPPPDFYVSVVDARESPLPSLDELMTMLDQTPDLPEPPARGAPATAAPLPAPSPLTSSSRSWRSWLSFNPFHWARSPSAGPTSQLVDVEDVPPRGAGRNPMPYLKQGDRNVVVAVVKDGGVSWMRFGRGVFGQMAIQ